MVDAICNEIVQRADRRSIDSVYFGGGTPSLLTVEELGRIIAEVRTGFDLSGVREFNLELNPEDAEEDYLQGLKDLGVDRLSMGIQSFFDQDLEPMNRVHLAADAYRALEVATKVGFEKLTVDLIYGVPWAGEDHFERNLAEIVRLGIPHLSAYALTVEERTALAYQIAKGKVFPVDDERAFREFSLLQSWAVRQGFEHYEISNLARTGQRAVHNSNYWSEANYLGFGPSAHSFEKGRRSWNVANNVQYIRAISNDILPSEKESLSTTDQYNEWVMTGLRLLDGLAKKDLAQWPEQMQVYFYQEIQPKLATGALVETNTHFRLASDQRFFADGHASDLFYLDTVGG